MLVDTIAKESIEVVHPALLNVHPLANLIPAMSSEEFAELRADVGRVGVANALLTTNGRDVYDGRHRLQAALETDQETVPILIRPLEESEMLSHIWRQAIPRRHLTPGQRAMLTVLFQEKLDTTKVKGQKSRDFLAELSGVSARTVQDALTVRKKTPELMDLVLDNKISLQDAKRLSKETPEVAALAADKIARGDAPGADVALRHIKRDLNTNAVHKGAHVIGGTIKQKFKTIVIDPPWDYNDIGITVHGSNHRGDVDYSTMSLEEITNLKIGKKPLSEMGEDESHIYLWTTTGFLEASYDLLRAWGYEFKSILVWCKTLDSDPERPAPGTGYYFQNSTEFVLFGARGNMATLKPEVGTFFCAPRTRLNSQKPELFYQIVNQCSPGPYLEVFSRQARDGWVTWGVDQNA